tara:strand:- start:639 stop:1496 length:858 start_codon:yes stop_codon:yes gene_type:complete
MIKLFIIIFIILILYLLLFHKSKLIEYLDNKKYFFYISKSPNLYCTHNINDRKIGYISDTDKNFINAISKSYRIKPSKLIKLNPKVPIFDNVDFGIISVSKNSNIFNVISDFDLFIYSFDNIDIDRINIFMKNIKLQDDFNIKEFWNFNKKITTNKTTGLYIDSTENFITRLKRDPEIENPKYHCYNDKTNINKQLCNMKYDTFGNIKNPQTIWDKPCEKNEDCPFYNKNKHYQTHKGKCIDNYCELPIGVRRLSYTKYDDSGIVNKPFCHNTEKCNDDSDYVFA